VERKRVARLMKAAGICGVSRLGCSKEASFIAGVERLFHKEIGFSAPC